MKAKYKPKIGLLERARLAEKNAKEAMESAKATFRKAHDVYVAAGILVNEIEAHQVPEKQSDQESPA